MRPVETPDEFFAGYEEARLVFQTLRAAVDEIGPFDLRVSRSQVAFRRRVNFALAWIPDAYLGGGHASLVLTVSFRHRDRSARWKQIVEPQPGRFTHHLELRSPADIDDEVRRWLRQAWEVAA